MGKHRATSGGKLAGGLLLGAVASGSLAVAALSGAGTANAGCVSISGQTFSSGGGGTCVTTEELGNIAVANGVDAYAEAGFAGPGNISIAAGTGAIASTFGGGNFALAHGEPGNNDGTGDTFPVIPFSEEFTFDSNIPADENTPTQAYAVGVLNRAFAIGNGSTAQAYNYDSDPATPGNNVANTQGNGSNSLALSGDNFGLAIASGQIANAIGDAKNALNGTNNVP